MSRKRRLNVMRHHFEALEYPPHSFGGVGGGNLALPLRISIDPA
jgi:hypothetical protein